MVEVFAFGVGVLGVTQGTAVPDVVNMVIHELLHGRQNADLGLEVVTLHQKKVLELVLRQCSVHRKAGVHGGESFRRQHWEVMMDLHSVGAENDFLLVNVGNGNWHFVAHRRCWHSDRRGWNVQCGCLRRWGQRTRDTMGTRS